MTGGVNNVEQVLAHFFLVDTIGLVVEGDTSRFNGDSSRLFSSTVVLTGTRYCTSEGSFMLRSTDIQPVFVRGDPYDFLSSAGEMCNPSSGSGDVNTTILTSNINLTIGIYIDISSSELFGSVFPGDGVFFLARSSSQVSPGVVREDSSRAGVEDESHGGNGVVVNSSTETNKGLRLFVEELSISANSGTGNDFLSTNKSKSESSSDLSVTGLVPVGRAPVDFFVLDNLVHIDMQFSLVETIEAEQGAAGVGSIM